MYIIKAFFYWLGDLLLAHLYQAQAYKTGLSNIISNEFEMILISRIKIKYFNYWSF